MNVIETKNLGKRLSTSSNQELLILDNINLSITQGESVAITGASGSGKTTLLGLLAGLDIPSDGEASLLGKALSKLDEDERAALRLGKVGFVFQSFHLMDNLSALENVMLPLELDKNNDNIRQRALDALKQVGLEDRTTHLPTQLSGGEQQRVALARAFVSKPSILFADEPTGNLDQRTALKIFELMQELNDELKTAFIIVTHDLLLAKKMDKTYQLIDGVLTH